MASEQQVVSIDDIVSLDISVEAKSLNKPNPNRICIITDEGNSEKEVAILGNNRNIFSEYYPSSTKTGMMINSIFGQTPSLISGGGDVLVISLKYMNSTKKFKLWTMPFPSSETLAKIKTFDVAYKFDDGDQVDTKLRLDIDKYKNTTSSETRESIFLKSLQSVFNSDFKIYKDATGSLLIFELLETSIIDKFELVKPIAVKTKIIDSLTTQLETFISSPFYKELESLDINTVDIHKESVYKQYKETIESSLIKFKKDKSIIVENGGDSEKWDTLISKLNGFNSTLDEIIEKINQFYEFVGLIYKNITSIIKSDRYIELEDKIKILDTFTISELSDLKNLVISFNDSVIDNFNIILKYYGCREIKDIDNLESECKIKKDENYEITLSELKKLKDYKSSIDTQTKNIEQEILFISKYSTDLNTVIEAKDWDLRENKDGKYSKLATNGYDSLKENAIKMFKYEEDNIKDNLLNKWKSEAKIGEKSKAIISFADEFIEKHTNLLAKRFPKLSQYEKYIRSVYSVGPVITQIKENENIKQEVKKIITNNSEDPNTLKIADDLLLGKDSAEDITNFFKGILSNLTGKPSDDKIEKDAKALDTIFSGFHKSEKSVLEKWIEKLKRAVAEDNYDKVLDAIIRDRSLVPPGWYEGWAKTIANKEATQGEIIRFYLDLCPFMAIGTKDDFISEANKLTDALKPYWKENQKENTKQLTSTRSNRRAK